MKFRQKEINILKVVVFALILVFYGALLTHKMNLPAADDLPRQLKIGETILQGNFDILYKNIYSYTEPEQNFYNHHWLSGIIFYLLQSAVGWSGLVVIKVIVFLAAFTLLFRTAMKKADFWLVAFLSLPTILILRERTGLRPEVFSYLFIAIYFYLLVDFEKNPQNKKIFWLIPLQLLWVNMHVFFSIGIMMVAGFLAEKVILNLKNLRQNPVIKKLGFLLVSLFAVSLINPRGLSGVFYRYPGKNFPLLISENLSPANFLRLEHTWEDVSIVIFKIAVVLLALSFLISFKKKPIFYFLASVSTAVLGFMILRGIALFGLVFLPAVSENLNPIFVRIRDRLRSDAPRSAKIYGRVLAGCLIVTLSLLIFPGWPVLTKYKYPGLGLAAWSEGSAQFFKEHKLSCFIPTRKVAYKR